MAHALTGIFIEMHLHLLMITIIINSRVTSLLTQAKASIFLSQRTFLVAFVLVGGFMTPSNDLHSLLTTMTYLMTRYSLQRGTENLTCGSMVAAEGIKQHLELLLTHPDVQNSPSARSAYQGLLCEWCSIVTQHQDSITTTRCNYQTPLSLAEPHTTSDHACNIH